MRLVVRTRVPSQQVAAWKGRHPTKDHFDVVIDGNAKVFGPDGKLLLQLIRNELDPQIVEDTYPVFKWMKQFKSDARGMYAGAVGMGRWKRKDGTWSTSKIKKPIDKDGNIINVASAIAGYIEPQGGRHPFCRATKVTRDHPEKWSLMQDLLRTSAAAYQRHAPERYEAQMAYVKQTHSAWVVEGSPFTTVTVNNHVPAAYHQDAGDLKDGMGCMMVFKQGTYRGFELVVPEYRLAVRMEHADLLLFDPTIWHGNMPPFDESDDAERISVVMYYRKGITGCDTPANEVLKAQQKETL